MLMLPEKKMGSFPHNKLEEEHSVANVEVINEKIEKMDLNSYRIDEKISKKHKNMIADEVLHKKTLGYFKNKSFLHTKEALKCGLRKSDKIKSEKCFNYFFVSVSLSFIIGLFLGILIVICTRKPVIVNRTVNFTDVYTNAHTRTLNSIKETNVYNNLDVSDQNNNKFPTVAFTGEDLDKYNIKYNKKDMYPKSLTENMKNILKDNNNVYLKHTISAVIKDVKQKNNITDDTVLYDNIFWGPSIEKALPKGYDDNSQRIWEKYIEQAEIVSMEAGCGRMYNRLVTFKDGIQACVRYRQNTDQIQGETFSYYVGRLLKLTNLAPSVVKIVDPKDKLWNTVVNDIAMSQWNTNRAVVITQYIPSLESANIPNIFKPSNRHLNKYDIYQITMKENSTINNNILLDKIKTKKVADNVSIENFKYLNMKLSEKTLKEFKELAQWSDLIIFDYLTANLDRIVNNLFNFQWNINIMDGPAHNLARKIDNDLLVFLDNESGLLHGYRLLKKYNVYHNLMLDNLCVFRKTTVTALSEVYKDKSIGAKISEMYHLKNSAVVRDVLPPLPEKNAKILHDRVGKILSQVKKCKEQFGF